MWPWSALLVKFLLLACLSVAAGAAATILNGLLVYVRHHLAGSIRPRADYVTEKSLLLLVSSTLAALLLLTQTREVPWEWLGTLTPLVTIPLALLRQLLLKFLVLACLSVAAGASATILHGLLVYRRLAGSRPLLYDCVTQKSLLLAVSSTMAALLLLTQTREVPWEWLGTLTLLVAIAPALLTWLGPPNEHVENCQLCQIGKGSAYAHYFGYLRLMEGDHGIRKRLEKFKRENPAGFPEEELEKLYSKAIVVLAPKDGSYPEQWDRLRGVGKITATLKPFKKRVGGNERSYGEFKIHEVKSSDDKSKIKMHVALDKVGALETLEKLRHHGPAGLSAADCRQQMKELMEELEEIVSDNGHLTGQLKVVSYDADEHVGDAILNAITEG
ncbi:hypothetical protein FJT64_023844 [Amphibalanus amphitrite]|uniref:STING ligand-binding domain-containing protein n=1 Tax=Amphibalanus amphitrite TaxID=1232801 RepID=A0A6A4WAN9_AMPAM|nr:hypothetical protein FJT64_023844 [Amphibalanus amphitrite]